MKNILLPLIIVIASLIATAAYSEEDRSTQIWRTTGAITIDGILDEADWVNNPTVGEFVFPWWTSGEKELTDARVLWDDENLYVSYVAYDKHISATYTEPNSPVSRDDCVEIFISPVMGQERPYMNFEINVLGTLLCRANPLEGDRPTLEPPGVKIGLSHSGTINDETDEDEWWIVEMSISFDTFTAVGIDKPEPKEGDTWRINLYRIGGNINPQYSCFNDTQTEKPQYHAPEHFGNLTYANPPTSVQENQDGTASAFSLKQNYPNPFNAGTTIEFTLPEPGFTTLRIYSAIGVEVAALVQDNLSRGTHSVDWDAGSLASGFYVYRLDAGSLTQTRKLLLLR
ncbi:carbohydrate-binding family 9-like protein [Candidatus Omnitrophota bacterium]